VRQSAWERNQNDLRARTPLETLLRYSDPEKVTWIHSMDGGISDNLPQAEQLRPELLPVRRLLVISVNAEEPPNPSWPKLGQIVSAATGAQIRAYNPETVIAVEHTVENVIGSILQM
jgi:hypothetical protein